MNFNLADPSTQKKKNLPEKLCKDLKVKHNYKRCKSYPHLFKTIIRKKTITIIEYIVFTENISRMKVQSNRSASSKHASTKTRFCTRKISLLSYSSVESRIFLNLCFRQVETRNIHRQIKRCWTRTWSRLGKQDISTEELHLLSRL